MSKRTFAKYQGKFWEVLYPANEKGRIDLTDLRDSSKGTSAKVEDVRFATQEEESSIMYFLMLE